VIGSGAVALDIAIGAAVIAISAFFLFVSFAAIRQEKSKLKWIVLALFCVFVATSFVLPKSAETRMFFKLRNLRSAEIKSVTANGRSISSRQEIDSLADELQKLNWFSSQHDGWGREVPLVIETQSGELITLRVAYYLKNRGAVVRGRLGGRHAYQDYDVGFSEGLLDTLISLGASLPQTR
jgi:hypothetical protein